MLIRFLMARPAPSIVSAVSIPTCLEADSE